MNLAQQAIASYNRDLPSIAELVKRELWKQYPFIGALQIKNLRISSGRREEIFICFDVISDLTFQGEAIIYYHNGWFRKGYRFRDCTLMFTTDGWPMRFKSLKELGEILSRHKPVKTTIHGIKNSSLLS